MAKHMNKGLSFADWPNDDRERFLALSKSTDMFDDAAFSGLSETSIKNYRYAYGLWLGFLRSESVNLDTPISLRVTLEAVQRYVEKLRRNCTETAVAIALQRLRLMITGLAPDVDWGWLRDIERRIAKGAQPLETPRVLSADLYQVGIDLIQDARNKAEIFERPILSQAEQFRDGLMIALLAEAPMRRACFTQLKLHEHVIKIGTRWNIFIPPEMTKTGEAQDYGISVDLSIFLEEYLEDYRPVFPQVDRHNGLWPYGNRPMTDKMVRRYVRKHTERRLGIAVSPHGFRRGSATFIAEVDPENVRMGKDILGHRSFAMTEKHYISAAGSRLAGQALAELVLKSNVE